MFSAILISTFENSGLSAWDIIIQLFSLAIFIASSIVFEFDTPTPSSDRALTPLSSFNSSKWLNVTPSKFFVTDGHWCISIKSNSLDLFLT